MQLGAFSVSLAVRDIYASRAFYEKLGFAATGGNIGQNWLILRNGSVTIGLFQGMFEKNMLTFNPGWTQDCEPLASFEDVRSIQRRLVATGIAPTQRADDASTGPAHVVVVDPDGNPVLLDQHVARPASP